MNFDPYTLIAWAVAALAFVLGVQVLGMAGLLALIVVLLLAITAGAFLGGRRIRRLAGRREARFEPTSEAFLDPATGQPLRVHADPETGERRYWQA